MKRYFLLTLCLSLNLWATESLKFPAFETLSLKNGIQIKYAYQKNNPITYIKAVINTGKINDPENKIGLSELTLSLIDTGTTIYPNEKINELINYHGGILEKTHTNFNSSIGIKLPHEQQVLAFDIISECLTNPTFPKKVFKRQKKQKLTTLKELELDAEYISQSNAKKALFKTPHSLKYNPNKNSIRNIKHKDIDHFFKTNYKANRITIYIIGNCNKENIQNQLVPKLKIQPSTKIENITMTLNPEQKTEIINKPKQTQTRITLLSTCPLLKNEDFYKHRILNYVLGASSFSSRLTKNLRSKLGNTYAIYSYFETTPLYGLFWITTFTKHENTIKTLEEIDKTIKKIALNGITEQELKDAKSYYKGNLPIRYETPFQKTNRIIRAEQQNISIKEIKNELIYLDKLTLKEINIYIKTYFKTHQFKTSIVTNIKEIDLEKINNKTTIIK